MLLLKTKEMKPLTITKCFERYLTSQLLHIFWLWTQHKRVIKIYLLRNMTANIFIYRYKENLNEVKLFRNFMFCFIYLYLYYYYYYYCFWRKQSLSNNFCLENIYFLSLNKLNFFNSFLILKNHCTDIVFFHLCNDLSITKLFMILSWKSFTRESNFKDISEQLWMKTWNVFEIFLNNNFID